MDLNSEVGLWWKPTIRNSVETSLCYKIHHCQFYQQWELFTRLRRHRTSKS